jgi:hypothetical protein
MLELAVSVVEGVDAGVEELVPVDDPEGVGVGVGTAVALLDSDVLPVFDCEAPALNDAVGEALSVLDADCVVLGVGAGVPVAEPVAEPVGEPVGVGAAEALPLWLTLGVFEGVTPADSDAVADCETLELAESVEVGVGADNAFRDTSGEVGEIDGVGVALENGREGRAGVGVGRADEEVGGGDAGGAGGDGFGGFANLARDHACIDDTKDEGGGAALQGEAAGVHGIGDGAGERALHAAVDGRGELRGEGRDVLGEGAGAERGGCCGAGVVRSERADEGEDAEEAEKERGGEGETEAHGVRWVGAGRRRQGWFSGSGKLPANVARFHGVRIARRGSELWQRLHPKVSYSERMDGR